MTPPTDSLEAALAKVPLVCRYCGAPDTPARRPVCTIQTLHDSVADYPALAAAAREWMRANLPPRTFTPLKYYDLYDAALADVARRLGL